MGKDYLHIVLTGFVSGILFRSFFDFGVSFSLFFVLLGFVSIILYYFEKKQIGKFLTLGVLLVCVGLGMLRLDISQLGNSNKALDSQVGGKIFAKALIVDEPDVRENNTRLIIKFISVSKNTSRDAIIETSKKAIITVDHYPEFHYGDEIEVIGILQKPKNFKTDDNREFDYISYLKKDGVNYQMFYPDIKFISSGNGFFIKEKLFAIKNAFIKNIRKITPEPHSSLLGGLVVGAKESLGSELQEDFRKVGLIHIVVLSGYNITIVAEFIMRVFSFLPNVFAMSTGALGIIFFAIMTGASATIVRASIMALLVLLARATGRVTQINRSLFIAGFLMLLHNPMILIFDPSFQLSFMATLGLINVSPLIEKYFHFLPTKFQLRESMVATLSTQIFVLPLLLYMMGDFSLVAVPVNLLVLIFIPITMLLGFLAGILSFVSTIIALPFAYLTYGLLAYELKIVDVFASLPFASINIPYFPFWLMLVVYGIYFFILIRLSPTSEPAT